MRRRPPRAVGPLLLVVLLTGGCAVSLGGGGDAPQAAATAATAPTAEDGTVTVPLQVVREGPAALAVAPVEIDGQGPYPFILDTGASTSAVTTDLADDLDLEATGRSAQVSGIMSTSQVPLVRVPDWTLGGVALRSATVGTLDFPSAPSSSGGGGADVVEVAGLLGSDQLSRFGSVTIDYAAQELRFTPSS